MSPILNTSFPTLKILWFSFVGHVPTLPPCLWLTLDVGTRDVGVGRRVVGMLNLQGHVTFIQANASRWFCGIFTKGACAAVRDNVGNSSPKLSVGNMFLELSLYYLIITKSL